MHPRRRKATLDIAIITIFAAIAIASIAATFQDTTQGNFNAKRTINLVA